MSHTVPSWGAWEERPAGSEEIERRTPPDSSQFLREDRKRLIQMARDTAVLYVLAALAEIEDADERLLATVTGLSPEEIRGAVKKLESGKFVVAGGKESLTYVSLSNLGGSAFGYYWKKLKRCGVSL